MTLDIEALAREAGIARRTVGEKAFFIGNDAQLAAYTNAVLEAAARECERPRLGGSEPVQPFELAEAIRALKVTP